LIKVRRMSLSVLHQGGVMVMLKRMELYGDAALLSFPCALLVFAILLMTGVIRGSSTATIALVGGVLAIPLARLLHRSAARDPLPRDKMMSMSLAALGAALVAGALGAATFYLSGSVLWVTVSILLLAITVAMVVDAIYDLVKVREHKIADVTRILLIGVLGASWLGSGPVAAVSADTGPWVVGVTAILVLTAAVAAGHGLAVPMPGPYRRKPPNPLWVSPLTAGCGRGGGNAGVPGTRPAVQGRRLRRVAGLRHIALQYVPHVGHAHECGTSS